MPIQFQEYLTFENIYLWANIGVLPFWLLLIFSPKSRIAQILVNSVIAPLILASAYVYVIYQSILLDESLISIFNLYLDFEDLYTIFATESFLLIFWLHFLSLSLFLGSWVSRDAIKYAISPTLVSICLVIIYFTGPLGLVVYWLIRVFLARKLGFHD